MRKNDLIKVPIALFQILVFSPVVVLEFILGEHVIRDYIISLA